MRDRKFLKSAASFRVLSQVPHLDDCRDRARWPHTLPIKARQSASCPSGYKGRILESIRANVGKVEARLKADPLAPDAYQLGQLITKFRTIPDTSLVELRKIRSSLAQDLKALGITN